ncbi:ABC transporter substrate-binding protein [Psychromonas antarctica]|jgi:peptide/nickel transport system substrate-binding protein|uniref:ABC transporter substrate-binding protein n=1 Tax=Psychromonas antarctica TaxID=67573 RepID=UPI001EE96B26|nr:ABC transporter substrate-binding protein [Psychromonas antarctica]MCG6200459.1 ABC transporter substrate-binding protein [Psychromonas antarctica]
MLRCLSYVFIFSLLLPVLFVNAIEKNQANQDVKTVQIAVDDIPVFFSPYASNPPELQYLHLFFDPLLRWTDKQELESRLLRKWETIKPGVSRFYLKKKIKFHSGNYLSSKDIIWTFSAILKEPKSRRFFEGIKSIVRVDQYTFDVHSNLSQGQLLDYLTHFFVLDGEFYRGHKIEANKAQPRVMTQYDKLSISGTGPYQIKQYEPALHLHVISNKNYWGKTAIKELNFIKIKSANSRQFALLANDVDISASVSNKTLDTVRFLATKSLVEVNVSNVVFLTINDKRTLAFKRSVARNAVHLAINQEGMVKHILNGMGRVNSTFLPFSQVKIELPNPQLPVYDVPRAKYLFSKITMPANLTLLVLVDEIGNTPQVAKALVYMMKRVGIKLIITEVTDIQDWKKQLLDYDFTLSVWQSSLLDRDNIYQDLFVDSVLSGYISELFNEGKITESINAQALFFEKMLQEHRLIPLFFQNQIWATESKYNLATIFSVNGIPYWHLLAVID